MILIIHWFLCLALAYIGFRRCIDIAPTAVVWVRCGVAALTPGSVAYAAVPNLVDSFRITVIGTVLLLVLTLWQLIKMLKGVKACRDRIQVFLTRAMRSWRQA